MEGLITLEQLISAVEGARLSGDGATPIEQLEYDSRLVKANSLFFAVKGFVQDGYDFVPAAKANGAVAVMGERSRCDEIENHVQVPDIRRGIIFPRSVIKYLSRFGSLYSIDRLESAQKRHTFLR